MTRTDDVAERLSDWLRTQLPEADDVRINVLGRSFFVMERTDGASANGRLELTSTWRTAGR